MFTGEKINITENRAVLHVALRAPKTEKIFVDARMSCRGVHEVLDKMAGFAERIRSGEWKDNTASASGTLSISASADRPGAGDGIPKR